MIRNKLVLSLMAGAVTLGLLGSSALTYAQSTTDSTSGTTSGSTIIRVHRGGFGSLIDRDQALADELGIDVETLQTAEEAAHIAMIDQAVADGYLTEEQAEQLKLYSGSMGRGGRFGSLYDTDEYLADALGITVEELDAAELAVHEAELAAAVAAGYLTQEEADLLLAEKAARNYLDREGLNAQITAAYEAAINAAVADGAITQAQADDLLAQLEGGIGLGHGWFGSGGRGGHRGFGFDSLPDSGSTDTTTDTSLDA